MPILNTALPGDCQFHVCTHGPYVVTANPNVSKFNGQFNIKRCTVLQNKTNLTAGGEGSLPFPLVLHILLSIVARGFLFYFVQMYTQGYSVKRKLGHQGGGSGGFVLPAGDEDLLGLVVTSQTVNSGFDQDKTEFGVGIGTVAFQVLADVHSLLDEVVKIFRQFGGNT